jgi:hypothetical protein
MIQLQEKLRSVVQRCLLPPPSGLSYKLLGVGLLAKRNLTALDGLYSMYLLSGS